mgnify:CR=1 FL=1
MEFDEFIPGNFLYTDRFSMKTTDGVSTQLVAGNPATGGFRDGKGLFARFRTIRGFTQISKTVVVLTDYDSSCLRQIDRETGQTSGYSGTCNDPGNQDGIPGQFFFPWSVVTDKMNRRQLFVTDHKNDALRTVHIELRAAATFVKYHGKSLLRYLTQDHNGDIFLPIADHALGRISYHNKTTTIISGSPLKAGDFQDRLSNSLFRVLEDLFFIEPTTLVRRTHHQGQPIWLEHRKSVVPHNLFGLPQQTILFTQHKQFCVHWSGGRNTYGNKQVYKTIFLNIVSCCQEKSYYLIKGYSRSSLILDKTNFENVHDTVFKIFCFFLWWVVCQNIVSDQLLFPQISCWQGG